MHPRNRYAHGQQDYAALAELVPELAAHVRHGEGQTWVDFSDPAATHALTRALLLRDFDLRVQLPVDRLVPTVPQKLNYLHLIEDLVALIPKSQRTQRGIDIGTGPVCIYAALYARMHPEYNMVATEIDPDAIQLARQNMRDNGLKKRVTVVPVQSPEAVLLSAVPDLPRATAEVGEPAKPRYDFVVCNPPFLGLDQAPANRTGRRPAPHRATATPAPSEQRVEGGEVAFAMQMIADSVALQRHIHWFTSMVGAKASLKPLVAHLKEIVGINCILTGSLIQGRTHRWVVAWTWSALERSPANLPEVTVIDCEQKWDADETAAGSLVAAEAEKKKNKKKKKKKKRNETTVEQEQEEEQLENGNGSGDAATHADDLSAPTATSAPAMGAKSTPPDNAASASAAAVATKDHSEAHPQRLEKLPTRGGVLRHDMPGRDAVEVGQALREALTYYRGIGLDHEQARLYEAAAAYRVKVRAICWPVDTSLPPVPPGAPPTDEPPEGMTLAPADWPLCSVVVNVGIVDADRGQDAGGNAGSGDDAAEATPSSKRPKTTVGTVRLEVECKLGATAVARRLFEWLLRVVEWRPKA